MTYWTITYGGVEKALADWGIGTDLSEEFVSKAKDTLSLTTIEPFDPLTPQFVPEQPILVQRDRVAGGSFTGGTAAFRGYVGELTMEGSANREAIGYTLFNAWWLLERLQFKQTRKVFNGWSTPHDPTTPPTFATVFLAETFLGEGPEALLWTATEAITEVLNFAIECWNPTKRGATTGRDNGQDPFIIGTIDCGILGPRTRYNGVSCAEAVIGLLQKFPSVGVTLDYNTNPPTLNMVDVLQGTPSALSLTLTAEQEDQVQIAPQYERQMEGVIIAYKQVNDIDGQPYPQVYKDVYPWNVTEWNPYVVTQVFDLEGAKTNHVTGNVVTLPLSPAFDADNAARLAFWQAAVSTLNDPALVPGTITVTAPNSMAVNDTDGNPVDVSACGVMDGLGNDITATVLTQYPNVLKPGCVVSTWMGVRWIEAVVKINVTFKSATVKTPGATAFTPRETKLLHWKVILTNAVTKTYSAIQSDDAGEDLPYQVIEAAPENLYPLAPSAPSWWPDPNSFAKSVYLSLKDLMYQGSITFVGQEARSDIRPGMLLTLVGPHHTFSNLQVQSVRVRPHRGEVTVKFGPIARRDAPGLLELWRGSRLRTLYNMPSGRSSGQTDADASFDTTGAAHKETTVYGRTSHQSLAVSQKVS